MNQIYIQDLEVFGFHGVLKEENHLGQKFLVSVELELKQDVRDDDLDQTVNYAHLCHRISDFFKEKVYQLIESAVNALCEDILTTYPLVQRAKVHIKKPWAPIHLPLQYAGVAAEKQWHHVYLGVGSNLGDKAENIRRALELLSFTSHTRVLCSSNLISTAPVGYADQDDFLNGAVEIETYLEPDALLDFLMSIEETLKRVRTIANGPRTIDLDILLYDSKVIGHGRVILPHPRMHEREFVLEPMVQIAPYAVHPLMGKRMIELYNTLKS